MHKFTANIEIVGVNPFVHVPEDILKEIFKKAAKDKGAIPITGTINNVQYKQTLIKYLGEWRLYINTTMLKNSPKRIGEKIDVSFEFDPKSREIEPPALFLKALNDNNEAKTIYGKLPPSRKLEIVRYLSRLKTQNSLERNVTRAINYLLGKERFVGKENPYRNNNSKKLT